MKTWLRDFFQLNWQRKGISVVLAVIVWFVVNYSLRETSSNKSQLYSSLSMAQMPVDLLKEKSMPLLPSIPIALFFPSDPLQQLNPTNCKFGAHDAIKYANGQTFINLSLFVKGVSPSFLKIVQDQLEVVVVVAPGASSATSKYAKNLEWSVQFINPKQLEDRFVAELMSAPTEDGMRGLSPALKEEIFRNRFRSYMANLKLFKSEDEPLALNLQLENDVVVIK